MPLGLCYGVFVDAGEARGHQTVGVEAPVLVAVGAEPLAAVVSVFVGEPHRDAVPGEGPELLDQAVVQLPDPLAGEQGLDLLAAIRKLGPVPPTAVGSVG